MFVEKFQISLGEKKHVADFFVGCRHAYWATRYNSVWLKTKEIQKKIRYKKFMQL